jgi:hypothetical protein
LGRLSKHIAFELAEESATGKVESDLDYIEEVEKAVAKFRS